MSDAPRPAFARVLFGSEGLRSGFRVLAFFSLLVPWTIGGALVAGGLSEGLDALGVSIEPGIDLLVLTAIAYAPAFVLTALLALLDRGGLRSGGVGGPWLRSAGDAVGGAVFGAALVLLALAVPAAAGDVSIGVAEVSWRWALIPVWFVGLVIAASWEEIVFRGYGFQWLCRATGNLLAMGVALVAPLEPERVGQWLSRAWWVLVSSVIFGLLHGSNPNADAISTLNTVLAGVWLAVAVFRTRALWMACGAHFGWNFMQGNVLGLPISGLGSSESGFAIPSVFATTLAGPQWATGGGYGIEASWASTLVLVVGIVVAALWPARRPPDSAHVLDIGSAADPSSSDLDGA